MMKKDNIIDLKNMILTELVDYDKLIVHEMLPEVAIRGIWSVPFLNFEN